MLSPSISNSAKSKFTLNTKLDHLSRQNIHEGNVNIFSTENEYELIKLGWQLRSSLEVVE